MKEKLIAIAGTTASGKSDLGVALARRFHGEIVSADSRQVYRGMNLGSGKITEEEMAGVPHHLLDVREPGEFFSMADFQRLAYRAIDEILDVIEDTAEVTALLTPIYNFKASKTAAVDEETMDGND